MKTAPEPVQSGCHRFQGRRDRRYRKLTAILASGALGMAVLGPAAAAPAMATGAGSMGVVATAFELGGHNEVNNVKLDWNSVGGAATYRVLRSADTAAVYSQVATVPGTSVDDDGLPLSQTFHYKVQALDASGQVLMESGPADASTYRESGTYSTYDNTAASSPRLKADLESNGVYYQFNYESDSNGFTQLVQQTSNDGLTFTGNTVVLSKSSLCASVAGGNCKLESLHVVKNPATGKFVMWAHLENNTDYSLAQVAVAEGTPGQPFRFVGTSRPLGNQSRDLTFFQDNDGSGYLVSAANNNQDLNLYKLSPDWTTVQSQTATLMPGAGREAPSLVHVGAYYYLFSSDTAGWMPSTPEYISATSLAGPWSAARAVGNTATFGAQSGGVKKFGERYAMVANRWGAQWKQPEPANTSRILPLSFNNGYAAFDYYSTVKYNESSQGIIPVQAGQLLSVAKPVTVSGVAPDAAGSTAAYAGGKGNDGTQTETGNYYQPDKVPFTWEVDLKSANTLSQIDLTTRLVKGSETYYSYTIQASIDRKNWTTVADQTNNTAVGFVDNQITDTAQYRYVRFNVSKVVNVQNGHEADWAAGVNEISVYGTPTNKSAPDTAATPSASPAGGTYFTAQKVALASSPDSTIYYSTDGSIPSRSNGTRYTGPITVASSEVIHAVAVAPGMIDSALMTQNYTISDPNTALSLAQPLYLSTVTGKAPNLPAQVNVNTASGTVKPLPVTWDLSGYDFAVPYQTVPVYGTVGSLTVSAQVEVVPASTIYYVDSSMLSTTPPFASVQSLLGSQLLNDAADQQSNGGSWGYVNDGNAYVAEHPGTTSDKFDTGLYALGGGSSSKPIIYKVPLSAGTYTVAAGFQEWWNNRQMDVSVVAPDGTSTPIAQGLQISANGNIGPKTALVSGQFTVTPAQAAAGPEQLKVTIGGESGAPVISWFSVAQGSVLVPPAKTPAAPTASVPGGNYKTAQTVSLTSDSPGAAIYYTTDGSAANRVNGKLYTGPITVAATETLNAIAFNDGVASNEFSATYNIVPDPGTYSSVPEGTTWYDTAGNPIQAHGGNILQHDGWYYWAGENKSDNSTNFKGISLYKSQDLQNWTYVQDILTPASSPELANVNIERPKLIYDAASKTFVLWAHWEQATNYSASHLMVATSQTVDGRYTFVRDFRPGAGHVTSADADPTYTGTDGLWGYGSRDFTVYQDPSTGAGYLISTENGSQMRVYKLINGGTDVDWNDSYIVFDGARREAPAVTKIGNYYFLFTSSQSGWYPNQAMYSYTTDPSNPNGWSALAPVGNNTAFYSQPTNILPITGKNGKTEYIYMGDRWNPKTLGASSYLWLPLSFSGTDGSGTPQAAMGYQPSISIDAARGTVTVPSDQLASQGKPVQAPEADSKYAPTSANDGNFFNLNTSGDDTHYYLPPSVPYTWRVDLGTLTDLSRVDISWRSYNGSETYSGYTVEGSNDDLNWTTLADRSGNTAVGFTSDTLSGSYRYLRVNVSKVVNDHNHNEADWAAGLVQVQVYGQGK